MKIDSRDAGGVMFFILMVTSNEKARTDKRRDKLDIYKRKGNRKHRRGMQH